VTAANWPINFALGWPAVPVIAVLAEAAQVRDLWLLAGSFSVCGVSTNGLSARISSPQRSTAASRRCARRVCPR